MHSVALLQAAHFTGANQLTKVPASKSSCIATRLAHCMYGITVAIHCYHTTPWARAHVAAYECGCYRGDSPSSGICSCSARVRHAASPVTHNRMCPRGATRGAGLYAHLTYQINLIIINLHYTPCHNNTAARTQEHVGCHTGRLDYLRFQGWLTARIRPVLLLLLHIGSHR